MPPVNARPKARTLTSKLRLLAVCIGAGASLVCAFFATRSLQQQIKNVPYATNTTSTIESEIEEPLFPIIHGDLNDYRNWKVSSVLPLVDAAPKIEEWGTYRPGYYFGMRTRLKDFPLSTGIMWSDSGRKKYRHETEQDELARLEWIRHDGQNFGEQVLQDSKLGLDLHTSFVIPRMDEPPRENEIRPAWMQKISVQGMDAGPLPFLFYFGMDCSYGPICLQKNLLTHLTVETDMTDKHHLVIIGHTAERGWFALQFHILASPESSLDASASPLSYVGMENADILALAQAISASPSRKPNSLLDAFGQLPNDLPRQAHSLAVQWLVHTPLDVHVTYFEHLPAQSSTEARSLLAPWTQHSVLTTAWSAWWQAYAAAFEDRFTRRFLSAHEASSLSSPAWEQDPVLQESAKRCLSSLLGGMGFFQGRPSLDHGEDEDGGRPTPTPSSSSSPDPSPDLVLLTATPSRTVFPRGFLWDEGFHQLVISRWNEALTLNVLQYWINALHVFDPSSSSSSPSGVVVGWIPREMILGEDARRRVPHEFVPQRVHIANPPTLLLVLDGLLHRHLPSPSSTCPAPSSEAAAVLQTLHALTPRMVAWYHGLLSTQAGPRPGLFRWRGRSRLDGKLLPNTLASGLDDYPRGDVVGRDDSHVDLVCWMHRATAVLHRLVEACPSPTQTRGLSPPPPPPSPASLLWTRRLETIAHHLDEVHGADRGQSGGYFDVGGHDEAAVVVSDVLFRCANLSTRRARDGFVPLAWLQQADGAVCPPDYPHPVGLVPDAAGQVQRRERRQADNVTWGRIPRIGYVNLFPLLLRVLAPTHARLGDVLAVMEDPALLYSDFGLRSLATTDQFYMRGNAEHDAPYWRGPIWININYLALGALRHYGQLPGPYQQRCQVLYTKLRNGLVSNVFGQYQSTGQFWEQYDDRTGHGMRGHPFTGWTSTVINILFELY